MTDRTTRAGTRERRNWAPIGRLRRIFHEHPFISTVLVLLPFAATGLFVNTAAEAAEARFERDVARIALSEDRKGYEFVKQEALGRVARLADSVRIKEDSARVLRANRRYVVVSIQDRRMWYMQGEDTVYTAPVAVGSGKTLVLGGTTKRFQTPRGVMTISEKELDPTWVPPNWHYVEYARNRGLCVRDMSNASPGALSGYPAGKEPVSGGCVIIPPWGSPQRAHKGVLGVAKLEMQDGYYFHGTKDEKSIGSAASHGCIRMLRDDIMWMYRTVPLGTRVYIY